MRCTKSRNTGVEKSEQEILVSVVLIYLTFSILTQNLTLNQYIFFYRKRFFKSVFTTKKSIILAFI